MTNEKKTPTQPSSTPPSKEEVSSSPSKVRPYTKAQRTKMWLGLAIVLVVFVVLGSLRVGNLTGRATGHGPASGCGGFVDSTSPEKLTQTNDPKQATPLALRKLPQPAESKVLPLPELIKQIQLQRQQTSAVSPAMLAKQPGIPSLVALPPNAKRGPEPKVLDLPTMLQTIRARQLASKQNPSVQERISKLSSASNSRLHKPMPVLSLSELLKRIQAKKNQ